MTKARRRNPDERPAVETRQEPSDGILPGRTVHEANNEAGARSLVEAFNAAAASLFTDGRWLDGIAAAIEAVKADVAAHEPKRRRYGQQAEAHLTGLRRALAEGKPEGAAWHGFQLGRALDRAGISRFEPPAKKGQERQVYWRGAWRDVTDLERLILEAIGQDGETAPLAAVYSHAWEAPYQPEQRGRIDKALAVLNRKLSTQDPPVRLHIHTDAIVVEEI